MAIELSVAYEEGFHVEARRTADGCTVPMDATTRAGGSGKNFSPIELLGAAYTGCTLIVMDLEARRSGFKIAGAQVNASLDVVNPENPLIGVIEMTVVLPRQLSDEQLDILRSAAHNCPLHNSLHPEIKKTLRFEMPQ
jgi:putative redox protein